MEKGALQIGFRLSDRQTSQISLQVHVLNAMPVEKIEWNIIICRIR